METQSEGEDVMPGEGGFPKQIPNWSWKALMGLLVASAVFAFSELYLRSLFGPPPPAVQVYSRAEFRGDWFEEHNGQVFPSYQHHKVGLFAAERTVPRFAVLGGSAVHGGTPNLSHKAEFASLLGKSVGVKPVNLGNPSLDSHDLIQILERLKSHRMDAWVIYSGHNDFGNGYFLQRYRGWPGGLRAYGRSFLEGLQIFWQLRKMTRLVVSHGALPDPRRQFAAPGIGPAQKSHMLMDYLRNMRRIAWMAEQEGVPLLVVVPGSSLLLPPLGACGDGSAMALWEKGMELHKSGSADAAEHLRAARDADCIPLRILGEAEEGLRALESPGLRIVDASKTLPREPGLDVPAADLFVDHVHLSAAGHSAVADLLAAPLEELLGSSK
jgi:lysophospholipase L1-like esterase